MKKPRLNLNFDPSPRCPLQCVSCPTGRREIAPDATMLHPVELERMLAAIAPQVEINHIALFNWGEPTLNRELPDLVRIGRYHAPVYVSTTGNHVRCEMADLVDAAPDSLILATSGWTQEIYETTHEGGYVERFKATARLLAALKARNVTICFHRYNNNLHEEPLVKRFARELGFKFHSNWGYHAPVEAIIEGKSNPFQVVPSADQLKIARTQKDFACGLQTSEVVFSRTGDMRGCTASSDQRILGNVFRQSIAELLQLKQEYDLCAKCYACHAYKVCCGSNVGVDAEAAHRSGFTGLKGLPYLIERLRKHAWKTWELPKVKTLSSPQPQP